MTSATFVVHFVKTLALVAALSATAIAADEYADDVVYDYWAYRQLTTLHEPDLRFPKLTDTGEIYRMVGGSYGTLPTVVRVDVWPNGVAAATVRIAGYSGRGEGFLEYERSFMVPREELQNLRAAFATAGFWKLPVYQGMYDDRGKLVGVPVCGDGIHILIEAQVGPRYRGVERSNCRREMFEQTLPIAEILKRIARPYVPADRHQFVYEKSEP